MGSYSYVKKCNCIYRQKNCLSIQNPALHYTTTPTRPCVRVSLPSQQELITALLAWNQMRRYVVIAIEKNGRTLRSNDNDGLSSENAMSFSNTNMLQLH